MSKTTSRIEMFANIAIIIVAIVLSVVLVKKFIFDDTSQTSKIKHPQVGAVINIPETNLSKNRNLILALKKGCRFCSESAPFYQNLVNFAGENDIGVVAVFPHSISEGEQYLKELNVSIPEYKQAVFSSFDISATPTLILTDQKGETKKVWVGKLNPGQEAEVYEALKQ